jgi:hypothetical protein
MSETVEIYVDGVGQWGWEQEKYKKEKRKEGKLQEDKIGSRKGLIKTKEMRQKSQVMRWNLYIV